MSAVSVSAQRSSTYDTERQVRLEGPVTRVEWVNPRAFLFIDVRDGSGVVTNWAVEFGNPIDLERLKWSRSTVRVATSSRSTAYPSRGLSRQALARSVVHKASGKRLFEAADRAASDEPSGACAALA